MLDVQFISKIVVSEFGPAVSAVYAWTQNPENRADGESEEPAEEMRVPFIMDAME